MTDYMKKALKEYLKDIKGFTGFPKKEVEFWLKDFANYVDSGLHLVAEHHRKQKNEKK